MVVDPTSLPLIDGTLVDFVKQGLNEAFKFKNPNIKGGSFKGAFEDAGFRDEDVIVAFDGDRKDHYPRMPQYYFYIEHKSGDRVEVLYLRDGKELKTTLIVP